MPRPLTTAASVALAMVVLASGGCAAGRDRTSASSAGSAPSTGTDQTRGSVGGSLGTESSGPARASGNGAQVCADALKASSAAAQVYVAELGKMLQATGASDSAAAKEAERRAAAAITDWSASLREQSARASDPRLKAVLAEIATEVGAMKPDIASVKESRLEELQQRLDELCGG